MELEQRVADFITQTKYDDLPTGVVDLAKRVLLTVLGTVIGGSHAEGCLDAVQQVRQWGGREEATILIHGGKVPAHNAAFVNSIMARALDYCEAMMPGLHAGSSTIPTALAAAELAGKCSGKDFLTALVVGTEVAARINSISVYDGLDPTGVCGIFGAAAVAGKILGLNSQEMLHTLALAFNRAGGSFQSNIDGTLAVRYVQGFVSQGAVVCAQLSARGVTGPPNFLEGIYGYPHLYGRGAKETGGLADQLGQIFKMEQILFKKYPSCAGTIAATQAILELIRETSLRPEEVDQIEVRVPTRHLKLVGHDFRIGDNPKVNAQFSLQFCVANALLRRDSKLAHFETAPVQDPRIMELAKRVRVSADTALDERRLGFSVRMQVGTCRGQSYSKAIDVPRGVPGNPLSSEEHRAHFDDCFDFAGCLPQGNREKIISMVDSLERIGDARALLPLLVSAG